MEAALTAQREGAATEKKSKTRQELSVMLQASSNVNLASITMVEKVAKRIRKELAFLRKITE